MYPVPVHGPLCVSAHRPAPCATPRYRAARDSDRRFVTTVRAAPDPTVIVAHTRASVGADEPAPGGGEADLQRRGATGGDREARRAVGRRRATGGGTAGRGGARRRRALRE